MKKHHQRQRSNLATEIPEGPLQKVVFDHRRLDCWLIDEETGSLRGHHLPASTASAGLLSVPVLGVLIAAALLGEPLGFREIMATVLTLCGVATAMHSTAATRKESQ